MSTTPIQSKPSTYSHILYLKDSERENYIARSASPASCSSSIHSASSIRHRPSNTSASSISSVSVMHTPKWVDEHYPLITSIDTSAVPDSVPRTHSAFWCAREMAQIHNTLIRAVNASYNHAIHVEAGTVTASDFLLYNQIIFKFIDHHHHTEDDFLFPELERMLQRPGAMEENTEGHHSFETGLKEFEKYVFTTRPADFDGFTLRGIIESFAPMLIQHLHDEIPTLVALHTLNSKQLKSVWEQAGKIATKDTDLYTDAPWIIGCQDKQFLIDGKKCEFPNMPWIAEALIRNFHAKRHAGVWKFLPCDLHGQRRQMAAIAA